MNLLIYKHFILYLQVRFNIARKLKIGKNHNLLRYRELAKPLKEGNDTDNWIKH